MYNFKSEQIFSKKFIGPFFEFYQSMINIVLECFCIDHV